MRRRAVTSREYKVRLLPEPFAGDATQLHQAVDRFWGELRPLLETIGLRDRGTFDHVKARRQIRFLDTASGSLRSDGCILRERVDLDDQGRQLTFKFRHPDRYVAQARDMRSRRKPAITKLEEDLKPPFSAVFSHSTTIGLGSNVPLSRLDQARRLFPGLAAGQAGEESQALSVVNGFVVRELVLVGAWLVLGRRHLQAECAIVIWHRADDPTGPPLTVELSYRYGDPDERYRASVARDAHDLLAALETGLPEWVHPDPMTKTAFVYG